MSEGPELVVVETASETTVNQAGLPTSDLLDDLISVACTALRVVAPASALSR